MDPTLSAAARALARGDALQALKYVALREDAQALALHATSLAQLGELKRAKQLFVRAARAFKPRDRVAYARCVVAQADVALAARELRLSDLELVRAIEVLRADGDLRNAGYAQLLRARHALWLGDVSGAMARIEALPTRGLPAYLRAVRELVAAELELRRVQPEAADRALDLAARAAAEAAIPALRAEIAALKQRLREPIARRLTPGSPTPERVSLADVAQLATARALVVDACRRELRQGERRVAFTTRPVLFALVRCLAEATPHEVTREALIALAFGIRRPNESLRARLRVAMGRIRKLLKELATLKATPGGYALLPAAGAVHVLVPLHDAAEAQLLALLADGEAWSTSAIGLSLGTSQRKVQRSLRALELAGNVRSLGRGRNQRWLCVPLSADLESAPRRSATSAPSPIATHMLLPGASPRAQNGVSIELHAQEAASHAAPAQQRTRRAAARVRPLRSRRAGARREL